MTKKKHQHPSTEQFRGKAERLSRILSLDAESTLDPASIYDIQKLIYELNRNQIELEMQNEELLRMHEELDASRTQFFDLYETAPVGCLTICANGLIREANLTASTLLCMPRSSFLAQPFTRFIHPDDLNAYYQKQEHSLTITEPLMMEVRLVRPDQTIFWAQLVIRSSRQGDAEWISRLIISDITGSKGLETALLESEERYRYLFESASDALFVIDSESGRILDTNTRALELYQYTRDELHGMRCWDCAVTEESSNWLISGARSKPDGVLMVPMHLHMKKDGSVFPVEITARSLTLNGQQRFFMAVRDISLRWNTDAVIAARMRLLRAADNLPLDKDLFQATLDEMEALTNSQIGFYHIMAPDQKTMSLQSWSSNTMQLCKLSRPDLHYSIDQAGFWAECIHQRRPVIHNDYAGLPQRKGLPQGHVEIIRELLVPVMRNDVVVALIGLGNKPTDYTEQDVRIVAILADLAWDITLRKRAEADLRESEEQYRFLFEAASDALLYLDGETSQILQANRQALAMYGYSHQELMGMDVVELSAEREKTMQCLHGTGKPQDRVIHAPVRLHRKKDGTIFPVEITGRCVPFKGQGKLLLSIRDISQRITAEKALRFSEQNRLEEQKIANALLRAQAENLSSIYQAMDSVGVIVCELGDGEARITVFNIGAEKLFGYSCGEVIGKSMGLIYPPEDMSLIAALVQDLSTGKAMHSFDMILVRRWGERFPAVVSLHPFAHVEGRCTKVVGIFQDISELMQAQTQLEAINMNLERRVEERTRELQETQKQYLHAEKLSALGKLSASIAHEFNNPLQGILSILKGLQKRAILEQEDKKLLGAAIGESERIRTLIRSLQEFNRPSPGKPSLVNIHNALDSLLLLYKNDFKKKRITLECHYAPRLPQIIAVSDQIKQVFLNLLNNAADACQDNGGLITVTTGSLEDQVFIAIKDTGCGIEPENLESIFEPFFTTKPAVKGTGLGLSVCHGIISNHGGRISVESQPGVGSTFTVLLPIKGGPDPGTQLTE